MALDPKVIKVLTQLQGDLSIIGRGIVLGVIEGEKNGKEYCLGSINIPSFGGESCSIVEGLDRDQRRAWPPRGTMIEFEMDASPQRKGYGYDGNNFKYTPKGQLPPELLGTLPEAEDVSDDQPRGN